MPDSFKMPEEETAVDDVRRVRDELDRASGGDMRKHVENTNASFEKLRERLATRLVMPESRAAPTTANG